MPNALAHEKSPYLLQHADNPVHWLPWGEAAFAQARAGQKPIFLSIGYSTCHWCHVMAHESFEDPAVAAILNEHFVAIKVDREERPDVDKVYMAYVQSLTGHGGWPLSAWLTPELKPFYGGTYFPPADRQGRAGFPAILRAIATGWANERDKLVAEANRVLGTMKAHYEAGAARETSDSKVADMALVEAASGALERGFHHLYESFDAAHGGFGGAPKFPRASNLSFLFRIAAMQRPPSEVGAEAVRLAAATLRAMARGGIHDHVGGGYHRYSVDEGWFVPHFEKMLYDQAQIAVNCLEAKQATGDERFAWMARDIFDYVRRELTNPAGGFYTAEDADSALPEAVQSDKLQGTSGKKPAHAEGAFYVWTAAELRAVLGDYGGAVPSPRSEVAGEGTRLPSDFAFLAAHFGVEENGNVPAQLDPHGEFGGKNILAQRRTLAETARQFGLTPEEANARLLAAIARLREVRTRRPRPLLDDKILTANNGLMISALARGAQVLEGRSLLAGDGVPELDESPAGGLLQAAVRAADFVLRELYDPSRGVLFRAWREGRGLNEGFAEDYAFFIQGLLDLYEASFELRWLQWAERLQAKMDELFWDETPVGQSLGRRGGYFNSAAGDTSIVLRLREDYDGAEPAPSSVAAMNLLRLGAMLGDGSAMPARRDETEQRGEGTAPPSNKSHRQRGVECIEAFRGQWARAPHAMPQMLCALELALDPPRHVVIAGDARADDFRALAAVLHERLGPRRTLLGLTGDADRAWWSVRAPWMAAMHARGGRATAYVCEEFTCREPVQSPEALRAALRQKGA